VAVFSFHLECCDFFVIKQSSHSRFLKRLTVESHDLECVDLVLRTFRRTVLSSLPADREAMLSWFDAYEYVTDRVQEVVRQMYDGMSLQILPINQ